MQSNVVLRAGFGRFAMDPPIPVFLALGGQATGIKDSLFVTCVAVCDGEETVLLFHMDMKETPDLIFLPCTEAIFKTFGIPRENVIMTATHTHISPHTTLKPESNERWRATLQDAVLKAAGEALDDLAPATMHASKGQTPGFAFVRRYLLADGSYKMNPRRADAPLRSESEADPELRCLRFARENKTDILLVNWQAHYGASGTEITSDFVHHLREKTEAALGVKLAYFNGGSANINLHNFAGAQKYADYIEVGLALADVVCEAIKNETPLASGPVRVNHTVLEGVVKPDPEEKKKGAVEVLHAPAEQRDELMEQYGFVSIQDVYSTASRAALGSSAPISLSAISFGDFAITANPFEMFDLNCRQIREMSPYAMTFSCAYSNGHYGYMPPSCVFPHGAYEVLKAFFICGTADDAVRETIRMLCENRKDPSNEN